MPKTMWICGDSNSGGVYGALRSDVPTPTDAAVWLRDNHPEYSVINQAVGAETSVDGTERVGLAASSGAPTLAFLCWGGADLLHEFGRLYPTEGAVLNIPPGAPHFTRALTAGRMIALARELNNAGSTSIIVRGVGVRQPDTDPAFASLPAETQAAFWALFNFMSPGYKQIIDAVTAADVRVMTVPPSNAKTGYHMSPTAAVWLDFLHLTSVGYADAACRVITYCEQFKLW